LSRKPDPPPPPPKKKEKHWFEEFLDVANRLYHEQNKDNKEYGDLT
jgi:hypothetical protein